MNVTKRASEAGVQRDGIARSVMWIADLAVQQRTARKLMKAGQPYN